jgi:steroid 5-alpha reductase family enzyme
LIADVLGASAVVIGGAMLMLWAVSLLIRDVSIVDIFWGLGFVAVAWTSLLVSGAEGARGVALVAMTSLWGVRLAGYLAWRNLGKGEDRRYVEMRERRDDSFWWQSLYIVFGFQGLLILVVSLPLVAGIGTYGDRSIHPIGYVGLGLYAIGLFFETVGDWQLARFLADPANRGQVMDRGLWRYTRHPNYFGDFCVWWGIAAVAAPDPARLWVLVGPVVMSVLLLRVSGVGLLEKGLEKRRPGYQDYIRRTSAFVPRPPKD